MFQNEEQAFRGGELIGNILFAYGHGVPSTQAFVACIYDNGALDVSLLKQSDKEDAADQLLAVAENAIAQCKVMGRKVESLTVACANGINIGGADAWSCFSSDNTMSAVAEVFFPCDNEGIQEWLRQVYGKLPEETEGSTILETFTVLREMSSILWTEFGMEQVADVDFIQEMTG